MLAILLYRKLTKFFYVGNTLISLLAFHWLSVQNSPIYLRHGVAYSHNPDCLFLENKLIIGCGCSRQGDEMESNY